MFRHFLFSLLLLAGSALGANDVEIRDLSVVNESGQPGFATLTFTAHWENSWRIATGPANWDAAWIFAKFRTSPTDGWQHVRLAAATAVPAGSVVEVMDGTGAMIYAAAKFTGDVVYPGITLRWDLRENGLSKLGDVEVRVYAVEMIYVPEGAFYVGSAEGGDEADRFYAGGSRNKNAFRIEHSGPIPIGDQRGKLYYEDVTDRGSVISGPIPAEFPTGFDAFYAMKYELSQQQYVDFFNTLTFQQQLVHDVTDDVGKNTDEDRRRNCISWNERIGGDARTTAPHVPVGYVSTFDMLAYLDWAGLRPMTETEFEKACRGPLDPLAHEYAWGTSEIVKKALAPSNVNRQDEAIPMAELENPLAGNAAYQHSTTHTTSGKGPYRCGIFSAAVLPATITASVNINYGNNGNGNGNGNGYLNSHKNGNGASTTSSILTEAQLYRIASGAGYYGHMELSGNQWEGVISVTHGDGLAFTNTHGDGRLNSEGSADVPTWPTTVAGIGIRGGRTDNTENFLCVAYRSYTTVISATERSRFYWLQFRGVRGL